MKNHTHSENGERHTSQALTQLSSGPRSPNRTPDPGSPPVPSSRKGKLSSDLNITGRWCVCQWYCAPTDVCAWPLPGLLICTTHPSRGTQPWTAAARGHPTTRLPTPLLVGVRVARSTGPLRMSSLQLLPLATSVCTSRRACGGWAEGTGLLLRLPAVCGEGEEPAALAPGPVS